MSSSLDIDISLVESEEDFLALAIVEAAAFKPSLRAQPMHGPTAPLALSAAHLLEVWKTDAESRLAVSRPLSPRDRSSAGESGTSSRPAAPASPSPPSVRQPGTRRRGPAFLRRDRQDQEREDAGPDVR